MERVVGIDFAGPARARDQRRKILAVAAERLAPRRYVISPHGLNQRLLEAPPGWAAFELADALIQSTVPVSVVAPDFPFSLPAALLSLSSFAALVGHPHAFGTWQAFNAFVASRLSLPGPVGFRGIAPDLPAARPEPVGLQPAVPSEGRCAPREVTE
ncbi:hypothetical protein KYC5002_19505 [Archangium violaceum]|uniref:hypothetical protein n=1 Tax=Archangium violaceum TaxID=83451 RepID=UPI002B2E0F51|nr:hypothetical protein KYC5002_19505 [Archangium gephyra]